MLPCMQSPMPAYHCPACWVRHAQFKQTNGLACCGGMLVMSALFASRRRHVNDCAAGRVIALRLIRPTADLCSCTATYQGAYRYRSRLSNRYIVFTSAHQVTDMQYRSNTTIDESWLFATTQSSVTL